MKFATRVSPAEAYARFERPLCAVCDRPMGWKRLGNTKRVRSGYVYGWRCNSCRGAQGNRKSSGTARPPAAATPSAASSTGRGIGAKRVARRITVEEAVAEGWFTPNALGGLCECGCGGLAPIARGTCRAGGRVFGQPQHFIRGHYSRGLQGASRVDDRSYAEAHIDRDPSGCWEWVGGRQREGYRRVKSTTRVCTEQQAHRFVYVVFGGEIPEGWHVHHSCGNRGCVNPDHLLPTPSGSEHHALDRARRRGQMYEAHQDAAQRIEQLERFIRANDLEVPECVVEFQLRLLAV